ncbi:vacuolar protein sorting-associated protein 54-like [Acanthaster planci]|uniref:Vacuolar protein sorting-associated protein 54 n=1 Tax=Acanthaster planci TaxID=133434 RepID=A0A8B7YEJ9_ACAPL|nr:vacuolar protein sorting-associated protein 54-like [Acanthaster planci]
MSGWESRTHSQSSLHSNPARLKQVHNAQQHGSRPSSSSATSSSNAKAGFGGGSNKSMTRSHRQSRHERTGSNSELGFLKQRTTPNSTPGHMPNWKSCRLCALTFKNPADFCLHLREYHCTKEGGSFVCRYGLNGVCATLPLEGVSDGDYESHVAKDHSLVSLADALGKNSNSSSSDSPTSSVPSVVNDQHKWTIYCSQVNLPAVLNDPRKAKRELDFLTKTWGETFVEKTDILPSPHLPHITRAHFETYLRWTGTRLKDHKKLGSSVSSASVDPSDHHQSPVCRLKERGSTELEQIPKVFFRNDFALENPDTFEAVLPWSQFKGQRLSDPAAGHQSSKLLQEKLSHYLDIVEVQIAQQISLRSNAFFNAMASHDKLQENLASTCRAIRELRGKINSIDAILAQGNLRILKLQMSRANYVKVFNKLKLMATVHQTQPTIQILLTTSEFVGALDLISTTQEVLTQELSGLQCFRHLGSQLVELEKLIDKMMTQDFARFTAADLNRPIDGLDHVDEDKLTAIVLGMLRQHRFSFLETYREEAAESIKALIKQTVVEAVSTADNVDNDANIGSLADQMRLLSFPQWLHLFQAVFENLGLLLIRVRETTNIIKRLVNLAAGYDPDSPAEPVVTGPDQNGLVECADEATALDNGDQDIEPQPQPSKFDEVASTPAEKLASDVDVLIAPIEHSRLMQSVQDLLLFVCDYAHDRCLKLLIARGKDGFLERLSSGEFVSLSRAIEKFVRKCESICERRSTSLRGGLQNQANKFINRFHEERKTKLSLILDSERWKQAEVPAEFQDLLSAMAKGEISLTLLVKADTGSGERKPLEHVEIANQRYSVVGTVLLLLKMVAEYCQCAIDIPSVTSDILTRLVEILQMFNSRSCQLILGAGALQVVGLKTITTKNLALTSRCLQLVTLFIPIVKEFFTQRLPPKMQGLLKNLDKILKDYNDHVQEISNKLVNIMDDSFRQLLSTWEVKAPVPSSCFREVCKRVRKLHEAIAELLPPEQIKVLFMRLNVSFKTHLRDALIRVKVKNDGGPKHGLVTSDLAFYTEFIQSLDGLHSIIDNMDDVWDLR